MISINIPTPTELISLPILKEKGVELWIKRDDLTHPEIQGNKWRKLKYNLEFAKSNNYKTILTFGGPISNHIYSTAAAGQQFGLKTIGVIRGYENLPLTPTLRFAKEKGMDLIFLSKSAYKSRFDEAFLNGINNNDGKIHVIPDGGANALALKGVAELYDEIDISYDICCVPIGTGATFAGTLFNLKNKTAIGFSSLKGEGIEDEIHSLLEGKIPSETKWNINKDYHFGGYGKMTLELEEFIQDFITKTNIHLDPIYTSKMIFGILDLVSKSQFERGTRILAVHTGGMQGWNKFK